jgi:hypothetical protein
MPPPTVLPLSTNTGKKVKFALEQAIKAQRSKGIALLFL